MVTSEANEALMDKAVAAGQQLSEPYHSTSGHTQYSNLGSHPHASVREYRSPTGRSVYMNFGEDEYGRIINAQFGSSTFWEGITQGQDGQLRRVKTRGEEAAFHIGGLIARIAEQSRRRQ